MRIKKFNESTEKFSYDDMVMKPLLSVIEDNQEMLTEHNGVSGVQENLGQLAKLGYIFNVLFYTGRICYGYHGSIEKNGSKMCENNPKYLIGDDIAYLDSEIEDLVYDAWGMHVSNDSMNPSYADFMKKLGGRQLTDFDRKQMKRNKTFDEWVEVLTDKRFRYHSIYPDRKSVANHLLCVIGNGYGFKNGFVVLEASGADQDQDLYADWENATFSPNIKPIIDTILSYPQVIEAIDKAHQTVEENKKKHSNSSDIQKLMDEVRKSMGEEAWAKIEKEREDRRAEERKKYTAYYPISDYSIISKFNSRTHPSYIKAGIEICENILSHQDEESKGFGNQPNGNIEFATNFLNKFRKS